MPSEHFVFLCSFRKPLRSSRIDRCAAEAVPHFLRLEHQLFKLRLGESRKVPAAVELASERPRRPFRRRNNRKETVVRRLLYYERLS